MRQAQWQATHPTQTDLCDLIATSKFNNKYCNTLPLVEPSAACDAAELGNLTSWIPGEQRTLWLWGDSIMKQMWSHLLCSLSQVVPPEHISQDAANLEFVAVSKIPPRPKKKKRRKKKTKGVASWLDWGQKGVGGHLLETPLTWSAELADASCEPIYGCARYDLSCIIRFPSCAWSFNVGLEHNNTESSIQTPLPACDDALLRGGHGGNNR
jgi:hypothetical protein